MTDRPDLPGVVADEVTEWDAFMRPKVASVRSGALESAEVVEFDGDLWIVSVQPSARNPLHVRDVWFGADRLYHCGGCGAAWASDETPPQGHEQVGR